MKLSSLAQATTRTVGSAMLGIATVALAKPHPDDHWSTSPKVSIRADFAGESRATLDDADADADTDMEPLAA
ncbi:MAG TPA: hypothetical protein VFN54_07450 [Acidimicrobiales bacterium]|nr:hypothetical protein [Acidimicrobiales bacterium]